MQVAVQFAHAEEAGSVQFIYSQVGHPPRATGRHTSSVPCACLFPHLLEVRGEVLLEFLETV